MKKFFLLIAIGNCFAFFAVYPVSAIASEPIILVLGDDWDKRSIARNSQAFERVLGGISNWLIQRRIRVLDEPMVPQGRSIHQRVRRTKENTLEVAQEFRTPVIDAVVALKIFPEIDTAAGETLLNALIVGNITNVSTGSLIGNVEVRLPEYLPVEKSCVVHRDCVIAAIGDQAQNLGQKVGEVLMKYFNRAMVVGRPSLSEANTSSEEPALLRVYKLTFDRFDPPEYHIAEKFIVAFSGYHRHEILLNMMRRVEISYETRSGDAMLKRSLRMVMVNMGIDASVRCIKHTCIISKN